MIAFLALISTGRAIVFGMMRVINLAHGEFVMLSGYTTIAAAKAGIDIYFAMLVISPPIFCPGLPPEQTGRRIRNVAGVTSACPRYPAPAASAKRANAGRDFEPVFFMIEARWFSTVRWLMPRSAATILLGLPARTNSMTWRCR